MDVECNAALPFIFYYIFFSFHYGGDTKPLSSFFIGADIGVDCNSDIDINTIPKLYIVLFLLIFQRGEEGDECGWGGRGGRIVFTICDCNSRDLVIITIACRLSEGYD